MDLVYAHGLTEYLDLLADLAVADRADLDIPTPDSLMIAMEARAC